MGHTYLIVDVHRGIIDVVEGEDVLRFLRGDKRAPVVMDITQAWEGFVRSVGDDFSRTFSVKDIAYFAGLTRGMTDFWIREGVLPPSVSPRRGSGHPREWSYQDGFFAGVLGCLARQRVPIAMLKAIVGELARVRAKTANTPKEKDGAAMAESA